MSSPLDLPGAVLARVVQRLCLHCSSHSFGQICWSVGCACPGCDVMGNPRNREKHHRESLKSLFSLSRVNWRLHGVVNPFLYHYPVCRDEAVTLLLESLSRRAEFVGYVRLLGLSSGDVSKVDLIKLCLPVAARCPNLQGLDLDFSQSHGPLPPTPAESAVLPNVRKLVVRRASANIVRGLVSWCPKLVSLELFSAGVCPLPTLGGVKEVRLFGVFLDNRGLESLLGSFPGLESFSYIEGTIINPGSHSFLTASDIQTVLLSRAPRLRRLELSLKARRYLGNPRVSFSVEELLGLLKGMMALEELILDAEGIIVHDISTPLKNDQVLVDLLPPSIRSLRVEGFRVGHTNNNVGVEAIQNIASNLERFPHLTTVKLSLVGMTKDQIREMRNIVWTAGVEFVVLDTGASHWGAWGRHGNGMPAGGLNLGRIREVYPMYRRLRYDGL